MHVPVSVGVSTIARVALTTLSTQRPLIDLYDALRPVHDGAGATVTRSTHEVRALARWGVANTAVEDRGVNVAWG
jgi:hypothetical protein